MAAKNLGTYDNNGAPACSSGEWPMPDSAPSSEADSGNIAPEWPTGKGTSDSNPPVGGNDGDIPDKVVA